MLNPKRREPERAPHSVSLNLKPSRPARVVVHNHDLTLLTPTDQNIVKACVPLLTIHSRILAGAGPYTSPARIGWYAPARVPGVRCCPSD